MHQGRIGMKLQDSSTKVKQQQKVISNDKIRENYDRLKHLLDRKFVCMIHIYRLLSNITNLLGLNSPVSSVLLILIIATSIL